MHRALIRTAASLCKPFILNLFLVVNALQCYQCLSLRSWSDCDSKKILRTCPAGFNRCAKIYGRKSVADAYGKGCERSLTCSTYCSNHLWSKCQINCCSGDGCNGVSDQPPSKGKALDPPTLGKGLDPGRGIRYKPIVVNFEYIFKLCQ